MAPFGILALVSTMALPPQTAELPAPLAGRIGAAVEELWRVPAGAARLMHVTRVPEGLTGDEPFRFAGQGADGWFVVVLEPAGGNPVALRVRAGVADTVAVAAGAIAAGTRLDRDDVRLEIRTRPGPPAARRPRPDQGWEVRRPLAAGDVLEPPAVSAPRAIEPGQPVSLVWWRGAVRVAVSGVATRSARIGEPVRARVEGSTRQLTGIAAADGIVLLENGDRP